MCHTDRRIHKISLDSMLHDHDMNKNIRPVIEDSKMPHQAVFRMANYRSTTKLVSSHTMSSKKHTLNPKSSKGQCFWTIQFSS